MYVVCAEREAWQQELDNIMSTADDDDDDDNYEPSQTSLASNSDESSISESGSRSVGKKNTGNPRKRGREGVVSPDRGAQADPESDGDDGADSPSLEAASDSEPTGRRQLQRQKRQTGGGISSDKKRRKEARNRGEQYVTPKGKEILSRNHPLALPEKCRQKCSTRVSEDQAAHINATFWGIGDYSKRSLYLASLISVTKKKSARAKQEGVVNKNRQFSHEYKVIIDGTDVPVCKKCLRCVLNVTNKAIEVAARKKLASSSGAIEDDQRGAGTPDNALSAERLQEVVDHINSFPKYESHYSRNKTDKLFLSSDLDMARMYDLYKEKVLNPVSRWIYEREFHKLGLSTKPTHADTCKTCDKLNVDITYAQNEELRAGYVRERELHHRKADKAYKEMQEDIRLSKNDDSIRVIAFDLQQCLPTPALTTGMVYYKRQLWTYNLTIHDCTTGQSTNFMWHEGIASRGANQIGSCLVDYIKNLPEKVKRLIAYSDTCGGQNKNSFVMAAFLYALQEKHSLEEIHHKFLLSGHTHMQCDTDHSVIERKKKRALNINVPRDYYNLVRSCGKRFTVIVMDRKKHYDFKPLFSQNGALVKRKKNTQGHNFEWRPTVWLMYTQNSPGKVMYKNTLDRGVEFWCLDVRRRPQDGVPNLQVNLAYNGPNPINPKKKKDLLELLDFIDPDCHDFYRNLATDIGARNTDPDLYSTDEDVDNDD